MPNRDTMDGQRYYVPIRPAHANSMLPESDELPSPKRKRVGVQVACDMCRNKKTRVNLLHLRTPIRLADHHVSPV